MGSAMIVFHAAQLEDVEMKVSQSLEDKVIRFPAEPDDWPKRKPISTRFEPANDDPDPPLPPAVGAQWPRLFPGL